MKTKLLFTEKSVKAQLRSKLINAFLVILGVFVSLLVLEASLRLSGAFYSKTYPTNRRIPVSDQPDKKSAVILCLGDSFTYGLGTTPENNYPVTLENMLNQDSARFRFIVDNYGSPGGNSFRILKIFKKYIRSQKPDLVIVMVGMNNSWNLEGRTHYGFSRFLNKLGFDVKDLRVYKLGVLLKAGLQKKLNTMKRENKILIFKEEINKSEVKKCGRLFDKSKNVFVPLDEWNALRHNEDEYRARGDSGQAINSLLSALKKYPNSCQIKRELIMFLREQGNYVAAIKSAQWVLDNCCLSRNELGYVHLNLAYCYGAKKMWQDARREIDCLLESEPLVESAFAELQVVCNAANGYNFKTEFNKIKNLVNSLYGKEVVRKLDQLFYLTQRRNELTRMFQEDLSGIADSAAERGIPLIFMTYPVFVDLNREIRNSARTKGVVLIDNEAIFDKRADKKNLFVADGHGNAKGYRLIAQNIYSAMENRNYLVYGAVNKQ